MTTTMESLITYISTAIFNDVGNSNHTCTVHINSKSQFVTESGVVSSVLTVNVGKL